MKIRILNIFQKHIYYIYNVAHCFIAWFTFIGTANWHQGFDDPTLLQKLYKWRIGPKTAWSLANSIWMEGYSK